MTSHSQSQSQSHSQNQSQCDRKKKYISRKYLRTYDHNEDINWNRTNDQNVIKMENDYSENY